MPDRSRAHVLVVALCCGVALAGLRAQEPAPPAAAPSDPPQATFRAGVDVVRVDVLVSDRQGRPVTDLTVDDFEVIDDGQRQTVEQFQLVTADGTRREGDPRPSVILDRDTELVEASREDVRIVAILLADYQICRERQLVVRDALVRFVREELGPNDLVAVVDPLESVRTLLFTYDHDAIIDAIRRFEGRKGEYTPRNAAEEAHMRYLPAIESIRHAVVRDAVNALAVRLGSMREGRKSLLLVSEGFPGLSGSTLMQMRDLARDANRQNVSIYTLDPRGLTAGGGLGGPQSNRRGCGGRVNRRSQETLRYLAEETDGRAIVDTSAIGAGLAQVMGDSSVYYLLGYTSSAEPREGEYRRISVRVTRPGVRVRARPGYWAPSAEDVARAARRAPDVPAAILDARAAITAATRSGRVVRTWLGTSRGEAGMTRVTASWEPAGVTGSRTALDADRVRLTAVAPDGTEYDAGERPIAASPRLLTLELPPGEVDLRLTVLSADGDTLDREVTPLHVPDFAAADAALSTPRVVPVQSAFELRAAAAGEAAPSARREFLRHERLLIRFEAYGDPRPAVTAALLNARGDRLADLPVREPLPGAPYQLDLTLSALAIGDYVVEVRANGDEATELVAFRLGTSAR